MLTRGNNPDELALPDARGDVLAVTAGTCGSAEQHGGRRRDHYPLHPPEFHGPFSLLIAHTGAAPATLGRCKGGAIRKRPPLILATH